jgi:V8-like Glu-specific endopeptidase
MNSKLTFLALTLTAVACGTTMEDPDAPLPPVAYQRGAIVGGTVANPTDTNVFQLIMSETSGQMGICSATLIGTRTLLTAAHCVDSARSVLAHNAPSDTQIQFGVNTFRALRWNVHPSWNPSSQDLRNDIALILLERAVPNATPKPWNNATMSGTQGRPIRALGYGNTTPGSGSGTRRQVGLTVSMITQQLIFMGDQSSRGICQGDSGGPTFYTFPDGVERVVGVHSFTASQSCTYGADSRVDAFASFVQQFLTMYEAPSCDRDGRCATNCPMTDFDCVCAKDNICSSLCLALSGGVDPDCPDCGPNGLCATTTCADPDPDCVAEGQACNQATQCVNRECRNDPQNLQPYCTRACVNPTDCPMGFDCHASLAGPKYCLRRQLPIVTAGGACRFGTNFCDVDLVCTGPTEAEAVCQITCRNVGDCPTGWTCTTGFNSFRHCQEPLKPQILLPKASIASSIARTGCSSVGGLSLLPVALLLRRRRR